MEKHNVMNGGNKVMKAQEKPRIGIYTAGLKAYWEQFEGLHDRLIEYGNHVAAQLETKRMFIIMVGR